MLENGSMLLENIPLRYMVRKGRRDTFAVLVISTIVESLVWLRPDLVPNVSIAIPSFLGTAISLILSFKLSQSYDRWWEARKIWGAIVNDSRTLVRQVLSFAGELSEVAGRIAHRQIAWCYCLGQALRGQDWRVGTAAHLTPEDAREAEAHNNKALALMQQHARDIALLAREHELSDFLRVALDHTLTRLTDSMGKAERIRSTVFPATYRMFLHGFIYLFISLLSIALGEISGAWQVLVTTLISIPFFLLEKTAVHLQDPFSGLPTDTPVTSIARTIEINLLQLIGEKQVPQPLEADAYYLM